MAARRSLNQDFFKNWSGDMAYVLGFFAADGSMLETSRGGHFIDFNITDRIVLTQIRRAIGSNHKLTKRPIRNENWKPIYRLQIGSKEWFADLSRLGFTQHKSNSLQFPQVPEEYLGDFVRGYFDGDGCVYFEYLKYADRRTKRPVMLTIFTSGSRGFLDTLWETLKKNGIQGGSLKKKNRGLELVFSHRDSLALYKLMYHTESASRLYLPRKRRKLEQAIGALGLDK